MGRVSDRLPSAAGRHRRNEPFDVHHEVVPPTRHLDAPRNDSFGHQPFRHCFHAQLSHLRLVPDYLEFRYAFQVRSPLNLNRLTHM